MAQWQQVFILCFAVINLLVFFKGYRECKHKRNAYGLTPFLLPLGVIAWGDAIIFGFFWNIVSIVTLALNDWCLFLLIIAVFWVVRSLGETVYWFNQQFSSKVYPWTKPETFPWHNIFHNDSVWFINQIIWQCIAVVAIVASIYLANLWLISRF